MLHLVKPLGFDMDDAKLRRAGLDYHDLAHVMVHESLDDALAQVPGRVWALTGHAERHVFGRCPTQMATACCLGANRWAYPRRR